MTRSIVLGTVALILALPASEPLPDDVKVVPLPKGAIVPDAATDSAGTVHVAYVLGRDLFYVKSTDSGKSFSTPLRVNSEDGFVSGGMYRGPDIAVGAGGRVHVAWYNDAYAQQKPQDQWGVMYAYLDSGMDKFTPERNLNHVPSDNYSLAVSPDNRVAVIWTAEGMFAALSGDGGKTFGEAVQIDKENVDPCECCATRAFFASDSRLYVVYRDKRENIRDMHLLIGKVSGNGIGEIKRVPVSGESWQIEACPMTGTFLEKFGQSAWLTTWETRGKISLAAFSLDGTLKDPGRLEGISPKGKYPLILAGKDNRVLAAWKRGRTLEWKLFRGLNDKEPLSGSAESPNMDRPAGAFTREGDFLLFP